jgi:molybdopterin-binding protein
MGRIRPCTIPGNELPGYRHAVLTGHILFLVACGADRAHGLCMSQSIRNRIPGTIREITSDPVLSEVVLDTTIGPVAAVITTRSLKELGLKVGDSVYGLVKATNVSIEKE